MIEKEEIPQVFQPVFTERQFNLVGAAVSALKIGIKADPLEHSIAEIAITVLVDAVGPEKFLEELTEINDILHKLAGRERCPDCGGYHS